VKLDVLWNWEAPAGAGDTHLAIYRGAKSSVEVRQGAGENYQPELYVAPGGPAVRARVAALANQYPGIAVEDQPSRMRITIPPEYRVGHEAHFAQVARQFFQYLDHPETFPSWENPNMLAKYFVSTTGVAMSQLA
jgi:hypothetical protein